MNKVENLIKLFEGMTILELNNFIEILESKYKLNEKKNLDIDIKEKDIEKKYSLVLDEIGNNKISIIKLIREVNSLGLKEAKDLVESFPVIIKENIDKNASEDLKKKLEDLGAKVVVK